MTNKEVKPDYIVVRTKLVAVNCTCEGSGCEVYLDDFESREEAEEALYELVLERLDFGIKEVEEVEG